MASDMSSPSLPTVPDVSDLINQVAAESPYNSTSSPLAQCVAATVQAQIAHAMNLPEASDYLGRADSAGRDHMTGHAHKNIIKQDVEFVAAAQDAVDPVAAKAIDLTKCFNFSNHEFTPVLQPKEYKGHADLIPEISFTPDRRLYKKFSTQNQQNFTREFWVQSNHFRDQLFKLLEKKWPSFHYALRKFATSYGSLYNFIRAIIYRIQVADKKAQHRALFDLVRRGSQFTDAHQYAQNVDAMRQQISRTGTITVDAGEFGSFLVAHHLGSTLPPEPSEGWNMAVIDHHVQLHVQTTSTMSAHAAVTGSSQKTPKSGGQAHGAGHKVPKGVYVDSRGTHCSYCNRIVKADGKHHNEDNCHQKQRDLGQHKSHGAAHFQQTPAHRGGYPGGSRGGHRGGFSHSHAHYAGAPPQFEMYPGQPPYTPVITPQYPVNPASVYSSMSAYQPPSPYEPGQSTMYAHSALPHPHITRIIDCGASITTVGGNTPIHSVFPARLTLRTTQGCTQRVFQGTCNFIFPDTHGRTVRITLPAITSPDIQPDIVLLSYHQLLSLGYRINLCLTYGHIYTPTGQTIHLAVCDGVWHFPSVPNQPHIQLHVEEKLAHMVLGGSQIITRSRARSNPQPQPPAPPASPGVPPQAPIPENPPRIFSPTRLSSPALHFDSEAAFAQEEQPPAPPSPLKFFGNAYIDDVADTVTPVFQACDLGEVPAPIPVSTPVNTQPAPPKPITKPSKSQKSGRVITGSALTAAQAMDICQRAHDHHFHCSRQFLRKILRDTISDPAHRPSNRHIKEFLCSVCAMARSKAPPASTAHPPSQRLGDYAPGEFLYIDGSGAYNFPQPTLCGSTQHVVIADRVSHGKFALPTADKRAVTVLATIRKLQSHWGPKIKVIRLDQEFARTKEFQTWAAENDVALQESPPYIHQPNGGAERPHGLIQEYARVQKIQAGANDTLWPYSIRYAAKIWNRKPIHADPLQRTPLQLCPSLPFQHPQLQTPPWGCLMFAHVGQRTDRSTAAAARSTPGIFVGIDDTSPSYLFYDWDKHTVTKVGYAQFNVHKFPLREMLQAGQSVPSDFPTHSDTFRGALLHHPDKVADAPLAEALAGGQVVLDVPQKFFPEYKHPWRLQCHRPQVSKNGKVKLVVLFDKYHGPVSALPKSMRDYATKPKETVFEISPPSSGPDYSIRHALKLAYPHCNTLAEIAAASTRNLGIYPSHPAVAQAQAAYAAQSPPPLRLLSSAYTARTAGSMRLPPLKVPPRGTHFVQNTGSIGFQPTSRRAAKAHPSWPLWKKAEDDECNGINQQGVYQRVLRSTLPPNTQVLGTTYIYADKAKGPKARLCVRGDQEKNKPGRDQTYAGTPGAGQVRIVVGHANQHGRALWKWDVSQAFTQADPFPPDVHIYIQPPPGQEEDGYVWRLLRPLYGLAIAPACWSNTLRAYLTEEGWVPVVHGDDTMYKFTVYNHNPNNNANNNPEFSPTDNDLILIFHVDDILLSVHPTCEHAANNFKTKFLTRFKARDEGLVTQYVGVDITRIQDRTYLTQTPLIEELVEFCGLSECNSTLTPMEPGTHLLEEHRRPDPDPHITKYYQHIVGTLQYLTHWTRPDIAFTVHELSKHQCNPGDVHVDAAKRLVRYLHGTSNYGIVFRKVYNNIDRIYAFADADWAGDTDTRKSLSANVFFYNGGPIMWHCKQQQGVATSTSEAEFVSASTAAKDAEYLRRVMAGLGLHQPGPTPLYEDNRACRQMSENPVAKSRTRHIDVAQHKVRDLVRHNVVRLLDCPTADMAADILTKALPAPTFRQHRDTILGYTLPSAPPLPPRLPAWRFMF